MAYFWTIRVKIWGRPTSLIHLKNEIIYQSGFMGDIICALLADRFDFIINISYNLVGFTAV